MTLEVYPSDNRTRPHTQVIVDSSGVGANSSGSQKAITVFGSAKGGQPGEFYKLSSFAQAKSIFKSGPLLDFIEVAWRPSDSLQGAGIIYAMRVDTATQAIYSSDDIVFKAYQYGVDGNRVSIKLEDGSIPGSHKFTAYDSTSQAREIYDNLGRIIDVNLKPTSTVPYASVTVNNGVITLKSGSDKDSAEVVSQFILTSDLSVTSLVTQINLLSDFQAFVLPYGDKSIDLSLLEDLEETPVTTSVSANLTSIVGDLINQLQYSSLVVAELPNSAPTTTTSTTVNP